MKLLSPALLGFSPGFSAAHPEVGEALTRISTKYQTLRGSLSGGKDPNSLSTMESLVGRPEDPYVSLALRFTEGDWWAFRALNPIAIQQVNGLDLPVAGIHADIMLAMFVDPGHLRKSALEHMRNMIHHDLLLTLSLLGVDVPAYTIVTYLGQVQGAPTFSPARGRQPA